MKKKILIPVADGTEELEAVAVIDVLRRAGFEVTVASVNKLEIIASRDLKLVADKLLVECADETYDLIVLPGGHHGTEALRDSELLVEMLKAQQVQGRMLAAICAAPVLVLQHHGLLDGQRATCHPSLWDKLANCSKDRVVVAGNYITSQGPGTAVEFALKLVELLANKQIAQTVAQALVF